MARRSLPPGFRFHPTDVELIKYYLKRKVMGKRFPIEAIPEVDIYKFAPWDLRDKSSSSRRDLKWYFFCPREKKYAKGGRMNRATDFGFWKTTGKDRPVIHGGKTVGMIRSLIFHHREPHVQRTDWVMHEYRLEDMDLSGVAQDAFVICMIFQKEGPGPRNGAQYGAPFNEEEWDSDEDVIDCSHGALADGLSAPAILPPNNQSSTIAVAPNAAENFFFGSTSNSDLSQFVQSASNRISCKTGNILVGDCPVQGAIDQCMDGISCGDILDLSAETQNEEDEIYEGLGDLEGSTILDGFRSDYTITGYSEQNMVDQFHSSGFLELADLESPLEQPNLNELFVELNDLESPLPCPTEACQYEGASCSNSTLGSFSFVCNPCGDAQLMTGLLVNPAAQSCPNLGQQPQLNRIVRPDNSDGVFFEENRVNNCTSYGYIEHHTTSSATDYSGNNLGMAEGPSLESLRRGYQRILYRRHQNLRDPAPVCGAKSYEGYALLPPPSGGTSLYVKAEVTRGSGGTKDALSIKLEGFLNQESQNGSGLGVGVTFSRCVSALLIYGSGLGVGVTFSRCMNTLLIYSLSVFLLIQSRIKTFYMNNRVVVVMSYILEYSIYYIIIAIIFRISIITTMV